MTQIVVLRGNSGSGKTTTAYQFREVFEGSTMIISQDAVRRDMLNVEDKPGNLSIELIQQLVLFGIGKYDVIVVEGIFNVKKYEDLFRWMVSLGHPIGFYYFELPFEETLRRHEEKQTKEFGEPELKSWWVPENYFDFVDEHVLTEKQSQREIVQLMIENLG